MCAVADDARDSSQDYVVTVVNMQYLIAVAKLRHPNFPATRIISLRNTEGLLTASQQSVYLWAASGTSSAENLFPRLQKKPLEITKPALEIELADCFYKNVNEFFLNMDHLNLDFSITRQIAHSDRGFLYESYFYLLENADEGYSHSVNFRTNSPVDFVQVSTDGLFFIVHTVKNTILLVNTLDGDLVWLSLLDLQYL